MNPIQGFINDTRAKWTTAKTLAKARAGMSGTRAVVELVIAGIIFAALFPTVMSQVTSADTTGWGGAVIVVFFVLFPILLVIDAVLGLSGRGGLI